MNILLTGATGFLGRRLLPRLLEVGHTVFCLVRREDAQLPAGARPIVADLSAPDLSQKLAGVHLDSVIHLAAAIATTRSKARLMQVNHAGTIDLVRALRGHSIRSFLFASTVVVGQANGALLTEQSTLNAQTTYGLSKQASERYLLNLFHSEGFPAIVFRPSHVYGPGGWFTDIVRDLKRGMFRLPGGGDNLWDVVHVDDVVAGTLLLLEKGGAGEIYHIVDDTPVRMKDFFTEAGRYVGKANIGSVPVWLANILIGKEPALSAIRSARSSNRKLHGLGWSPRYPAYRAGLAATFQELGEGAREMESHSR